MMAPSNGGSESTLGADALAIGAEELQPVVLQVYSSCGASIEVLGILAA